MTAWQRSRAGHSASCLSCATSASYCNANGYARPDKPISCHPDLTESLARLLRTKRLVWQKENGGSLGHVFALDSCAYEVFFGGRARGWCGIRTGGSVGKARLSTEILPVVVHVWL